MPRGGLRVRAVDLVSRRERLRSIPHIRASEVTVVDVPPQNGLIGYRDFRVTTACGEELTTTLTTRRADRVRCEKCKAEMAGGGE